MNCLGTLVLFALFLPYFSLAFSPHQALTTTRGIRMRQSTICCNIPKTRWQRCRCTIGLKNKNGDQDVQVGSKEYYAGFITRNMKEAEERVTGGKILIPTFKFVGGFAILLGILFVAFMVSNGIL